METGIARKEEWPRLRELWKMAFGDGEELIDGFFARYGQPDRLLVLREGGRPMSMLALLPMEAVTAGGKRLSLPYVYALATDPAARGRGYAKELLDYAARRARELGGVGICTVPAQPSLHKFFAAAGYGECFAARRRQLTLRETVTTGEVVPVGAAEYAGLREGLLAGLPHGAWSGELTGIQEGFSNSSGGGLYRLELEGGTGCAAVERWPGKMVAKELLCPRELLEGAEVLLSARLGERRWEFRTPAVPGEECWAFGMAIWFAGGLEREFGREAYFGLAFD